uniref:Uncharacterized protein n=1 Tax=Ralstonia solanacearum TaxID=305 RepID=A0A0S4WG35_RALSL|nr:protein of unknown function [Ralstonia solanacearum]
MRRSDQEVPDASNPTFRGAGAALVARALAVAADGGPLRGHDRLRRDDLAGRHAPRSCDPG